MTEHPLRRLTPGSLAERIDALLPQTQCTRCGYPSCRDYALALAQGETALNRCPPGGEAGIRLLADLLGMPLLPLDPDTGREGPRLLAFIESEHCIGCTKCIRACPVDAIIGGPKRMHTVLPDLCTGCELCVPPCPVDCIPMVPIPQVPWQPVDALAARERFVARHARLIRERRQDQDRHAGELATEWQQITSSDETPAAPIGHAKSTAQTGLPVAHASTVPVDGTQAGVRRDDPQESDAATRKRAIVAGALARATARLRARSSTNPPADPADEPSR